MLITPDTDNPRLTVQRADWPQHLRPGADYDAPPGGWASTADPAGSVASWIRAVEHEINRTA